MKEFTADQLSQTLGFRVHEISPEPVMTGGAHSRIYACKSEIGDLVLRVCKGQQGFYTHYFPGRANLDDWMDQAWAIENARSVGVPAPEIIHSNRDERWIVMKRILGVAIDSEYELWERCPYSEREFGKLLSRLHSIQPEGYGPIDDCGKALFTTWQDFLVQAAISALGTCVARGSLPLSVAKQLEQCWCRELASVDLHRPSLLHMESLGFANIMYNPDTRTITGLLDYEDCIGGDPLFEICWMRYYFNHSHPNQSYFDFQKFAEGYGSLDLDSDRIKLYSPFPLLDKLRWIDPVGSRARGYVRCLETFAGL